MKQKIKQAEKEANIYSKGFSKGFQIFKQYKIENKRGEELLKCLGNGKGRITEEDENPELYTPEKRIKEFNDGYNCGKKEAYKDILVKGEKPINEIIRQVQEETLQNVRISLLLQKTHNEGEDNLIRELIEKINYQIKKLYVQQDARRRSLHAKPLKEDSRDSIPVDKIQGTNHLGCMSNATLTAKGVPKSDKIPDNTQIKSSADLHTEER